MRGVAEIVIQGETKVIYACRPVYCPIKKQERVVWKAWIDTSKHDGLGFIGIDSDFKKFLYWNDCLGVWDVGCLNSTLNEKDHPPSLSVRFQTFIGINAWRSSSQDCACTLFRRDYLWSTSPPSFKNLNCPNLFSVGFKCEIQCIGMTVWECGMWVVLILH
ncbi:hypothetical protein TNCT_604361 [Trichonephila clavata]|uniref:Uncharacterized protein n=1 Tax=Trichonephila clavata TaxID=2740835 RepID=A0A8X6KXZ2_TRICU|nr:hypothetical protein TNCT_604361 [Trichonephila clavata]